LQHPISSPTTKSTQTTLGNAPNQHYSPLSAGKYGKLTKWSTQQSDQPNKGKSSFEAERIRALGASCSLGSKMKLAAKKQRENTFGKQSRQREMD
jgi:hypothetical protein